MEGFDYASGPIPPSVIKAAGRVFVCRYVKPGKWSVMQQQEYDELRNAGIPVVSVYEAGKDRSITAGFAGGAADMKDALAYIASIGGPANAPVYMIGNDFDRATSTMMAAAKSYIDGAVSVRGHALTGAYGDYYTIKYLADRNVCSFYWQTLAWSDGLWEPRAQLRQYKINQVVSGYSVDFDQSMTTNFGQWSISPCNDPLGELFGPEGC